VFGLIWPKGSWSCRANKPSAFFLWLRNKHLKSKLKGLGKCIVTQTVDDLFDEIFRQIGELRAVSCTLSGDSGLSLRCQDEVVAKVKLPRAKSILRMMCARLSVRCSEWAKREVSPYGDDVEFELPGMKSPCKVSFENTPDVERLEISVETGRRGKGTKSTPGVGKAGAPAPTMPDGRLRAQPGT